MTGRRDVVNYAETETQPPFQQVLSVSHDDLSRYCDRNSPLHQNRLMPFLWSAVFCLAVATLPSAQAQEAAPEPEEGVVDETIYYVTVTPTLILNIGKSQSGRFAYLKTDVAISVKGAAGKAIIEAHTPAVKNILVLGVSGQDESTVNTAEGREQIRLDLAKAIQEFLLEEAGKPYVEELMFTNFIVQL